ARDRECLRAYCDRRAFPAWGQYLLGAMAGHRCDHAGSHSCRSDSGKNYHTPAGAHSMKWILVGIIAICNTLGDVLNTAGMKRQGEVEDLSLGSLARMVKRIFRN